MQAVVLDAVADAGRLKHFDVKGGALLQALRLQQLALLGQLLQAHRQFLLDALDRLLQRRARRHIVAAGIDADLLEAVGLDPGQRIELGDRLQFVAEEVEPPGAVLKVGGPDLDQIAAHAKAAALKAGVQPLVLLRDQLAQELALVIAFAYDHVLGHRRIGLDRTDAIDAADRGHDDDVIALQQCPGGTVAHPVDGLVDLRFLLDIGIAAGHIGLGLVIVVVADEVLDRVVGEEPLEFAVQLGGQRLVGRQDDRGTLRLLDNLGHGEGLARPRGPQQHLVALSGADARHQFGDGRGLVARRFKFAFQCKALPALQLGAGHFGNAHHGRVGVVVTHEVPDPFGVALKM